MVALHTLCVDAFPDRASALNADFVLLALVTDAYGGRGGIAQYNRDLLNALIETGAVSSILAVPRWAEEGGSTPRGIQQVSPRHERIAYSLTAFRTALGHRIDVVYCGHLFMAPLALLVARLKNAKLIVQMHGIEAWQRPRALVRKAVEAANLVLCVSRHTRGAVLQWAAIPPERIVVLSNTVGEDFTPGDGSALRVTWGLQGKRVLLTVGRLSSTERYKGHDRVIRALPLLVAAGHDVVYVIAGAGDDRGRLQALAEEACVGERVRFVGALDTATLVDAYRMADIFVMPSTGEGFGIAFLEAMACGTPALGLNVAGACDALADGALGPTCTETELPDAIARILAAERPNRQALAAEVNRHFGRDVFAERAVAALRNLRNVA